MSFFKGVWMYLWYVTTVVLSVRYSEQKTLKLDPASHQRKAKWRTLNCLWVSLVPMFLWGADLNVWMNVFKEFKHFQLMKLSVSSIMKTFFMPYPVTVLSPSDSQRFHPSADCGRSLSWLASQILPPSPSANSLWRLHETQQAFS